MSDLLSKLVEHAGRLPYNPRYAYNPAEIDHWMRLIDNHISDKIAMGLQIKSYPGNGITDPSNRLVDRVEVLYVLGLLVGKQMQKELADLQMTSLPRKLEVKKTAVWKKCMLMRILYRD